MWGAPVVKMGLQGRTTMKRLRTTGVGNKNAMFAASKTTKHL